MKTRHYVLLASALAVLLALWKFSAPIDASVRPSNIVGTVPEERAGKSALDSPGGEGSDSRAALPAARSGELSQGPPSDSPALGEVAIEPAPPVLRGRVVTAAAGDESASPIPGAVLSYAEAKDDTFDPGNRATFAETDVEGHFELPVESWGKYPLTVAADGFLPHLMEVGPVRADIDLGDISLAKAHVVSGRVVDSSGRGIGGARILMHDPCSDDLSPYGWRITQRNLARTDAAGAFTVPVAAMSGAGSVWTLTALHDGFRPAQYQGHQDAALAQLPPIQITMERGSSIYGRVHGLDSGALQREGPLVVAVAPRTILEYLATEWHEDLSQRRVPVEDDGTFTVTGLGPGESVVLAVWTGDPTPSMESRARSEWHQATAPLDGASSHPVALEFVPPVRLRARAVDDAGIPITRIVIDGDMDTRVYASGVQRTIMEAAIFPNGEVEWVCTAAETKDLPRIAIETEDASGALLKSWSANVPRLAPGDLHDFGDVTPVDVAPPSIEREPVRVLLLRALDPDGHPCAGARIELAEASAKAGITLQTRTGGSEGRAHLEAPTDRDLRVRVAPASGSRRIDYEHRSLPEVEARAPWTYVPAGEEPLSMDLASPDAARVEIKVLYGGSPLPGASIVLRWIPLAVGSAGLKAPQRATPGGERTNGSGVWTSSGMIPGDWLARVYHPQLRMPERFEFRLVPGDNNITLERSRATLTGKVVDTNGRPIRGALVRAEAAKTSPLLAIHERDNHRMTPRLGGTKDSAALRDIRYVQTDGDGTFQLDGVEPRFAIKAIAMAPGFVAAQSKHVTLQSGDTVDLGALIMRPAGRLHVLIPLGSEGDVNIKPAPQPPGNEHLPYESWERWSSIFDREVLEGLEPGDWTVVVGHKPSVGEGEFTTTEHIVSIRAGETAELDLRGR